LEFSHDYIQTLFPLPEQSGVNDRAPIVDRLVFQAFRTRPELRDRLSDAFKKMLWFYGFELDADEEGSVVVSEVAVRLNSHVLNSVQVKRGPNYEAHAETWLTRFDHNHLRITRIIRCLRVLGLEDEAMAFYDTISCATIVSSRSRMYWRRAAHRPLNIRPDLDEDEADVDDERIGTKFLWEFEQNKKKHIQKRGQASTKDRIENEQVRNQARLDEADETNSLSGGSTVWEVVADASEPTNGDVG